VIPVRKQLGNKLLITLPSNNLKTSHSYTWADSRKAGGENFSERKKNPRIRNPSKQWGGDTKKLGPQDSRGVGRRSDASVRVAVGNIAARQGVTDTEIRRSKNNHKGKKKTFKIGVGRLKKVGGAVIVVNQPPVPLHQSP